jgi:hypothetical protein
MCAHITFLLLSAWVASINWQHGQSMTGALARVYFILSVILCVILHEFGHALTAKRNGVSTRDIIALPKEIFHM